MTTEQRKRPVNPFPGLRPFETEEYRLFFGREGQSDALIERLERSRFLAVVGTSGSGKSSLVRAGLLPGLRGGMMAGAGAGWRVAVLRPGHDPLGNLAHALAEEGVLAEAGAGLPAAEAEAVVEATLRRGSLGLVEAAAGARLGEREKLLVVVDQFEELFRFRAARAAAGSADDEAAAFVKLLLEAARQREVPAYVVLTMRSDFLGDCAQFQGLPEAINDGQYLIPRMTRDERRFAIVGPVRVARARMSEPLVNRLLNDVGDNPDQLPILQHALMRTWDYWSARRRDSEPIGLEHYEAVGTMSDALSLHADEAWGELPDDRSRRVAEVLFKALTERGADNREIRRPTRLREVCEIAGATPEEVAAVVEVFRREGRSFLMPPAGVPLTPETVIDISHESLIRNWDRLREWVRDEGEGARIYRRLADAAAAYRAGEGGLLDDVTIGWVNRWREKYEPNRAWGVRYHPGYDEAIAYLEESRAAQAARVAAEGERERRELEQARAYADQQRRANRKLRALMLALAALLAVAMATAGSAWSASRFAREQQAEADQQRKTAESQKVEAQQQRHIAEQQKVEIEGLLRESERQKGENARLLDEQKKINTALVKAEKRRNEALRVAQRQALIAADNARQARKAEEEAKLLLRENQKARVANEMFREGIVSMQRRDYDTAHGLLTDVFAEYESSDVHNPEAAADSRVQRGNVHYAVARDLLAVARGNLKYEGPKHRLKLFEKDYEQAAEMYAAPKVNSPYKAGATLYSLALQLLQTSAAAPDAVARGAAASDAQRSAFRLGEEPPGYRAISEDNAGPVPDWDPKVQFEEKARLRTRAAELYRRSLGLFDSAAGRGADDQLRAEEGKTRAALQLGNLYLYEANEARARGAAEADVYRREALESFAPLVADTSLDHLRGVQSKLAWVGGLFFELGGCGEKARQGAAECGEAERYFARARQKDSAEGLRHVAKLADAAGLLGAAAALYGRALEKYRAEGADPRASYDNLFQQAEMLYALGRVAEEESGEDSFDRAMARYREAVEKFKLTFNRPNSESEPENSTTSPEDLLRVGAVAEEVNDHALARDAYELLAQYGTRFKKYRIYKARALGELGSVYALLGEPTRALESYVLAAGVYREIAEDPFAPQFREEADEAVERVERAAAALKAAVGRAK